MSVIRTKHNSSVKLTGAELEHVKRIKTEMDRRARVLDGISKEIRSLNARYAGLREEMVVAWEQGCKELFQMIGLPEKELSDYALSVQFANDFDAAFLYKPGELAFDENEGGDDATRPPGMRLN